MKILHTSDWHLGKKLENYSRFEEQKIVLQEICDIADTEEVDAVVIAGDLFDTFNPSGEAVDLFYKTLKRLGKNGTRAVIAIAGNHDSPDRIEAPDPLARECGIFFAGYPHSIVPTVKVHNGVHITKSEPGFIELKMPGCSQPLRVLLTPYANEFRLKTFLQQTDSEVELRTVLEKFWNGLADKYCDNSGVNILCTHLFMVKKGQVLPDEPEDEKPILHVGGVQAVFAENVPKQIQYVALGHLHRQQEIDDERSIIYSGSPISYSFSEAHQNKFVMVAEIEPGLPSKTKAVELKTVRPLIRKKAGSVDEALQWLDENQHGLIELTICTDNYLTASERKALLKKHNGIISIIPEIKNIDITENNKSSIDLAKSREELFKEYFKYAKGQTPNDELMDLFKEIVSESNPDKS